MTPAESAGTVKQPYLVASRASLAIMLLGDHRLGRLAEVICVDLSNAASEAVQHGQPSWAKLLAQLDSPAVDLGQQVTRRCRRNRTKCPEGLAS